MNNEIREVDNELYFQIDKQLWNQVHNHIRTLILARVRDQVWDQIQRKVGTHVDAQIHKEIE